VQRLEPGIEVACVIDKPIGLRWRFSGLAHTDQVGSQAPSMLAEIGNNVPPKIGRGRVPVKKHDGVPLIA
jgi:hypothetical protein